MPAKEQNKSQVNSSNSHLITDHMIRLLQSLGNLQMICMCSSKFAIGSYLFLINSDLFHSIIILELQIRFYSFFIS